MHVLLHNVMLATLPAQVDEQSWSINQFLVWFGAPVLLVLAGFVIFFGARAQRRAIVDDARQRGGFGAEPGTTDVGSAEGFGIEEAREKVRVATGRVLTGLVLMLVGVLALLGLSVWRILS